VPRCGGIPGVEEFAGFWGGGGGGGGGGGPGFARGGWKRRGAMSWVDAGRVYKEDNVACASACAGTSYEVRSSSVEQGCVAYSGRVP